MSFWNCESINYAVVKCIIVSSVALFICSLQVLHHLVHQLGWPPLVTCLTAIFPSLSHWMYNHIVGKLLLMLHVNLEEVWKVINILLNWMVLLVYKPEQAPNMKKIVTAVCTRTYSTMEYRMCPPLYKAHSQLPTQIMVTCSTKNDGSLLLAWKKRLLFVTVLVLVSTIDG